MDLTRVKFLLICISVFVTGLVVSPIYNKYLQCDNRPNLLSGLLTPFDTYAKGITEEEVALLPPSGLEHVYITKTANHLEVRWMVRTSDFTSFELYKQREDETTATKISTIASEFTKPWCKEDNYKTYYFKDSNFEPNHSYVYTVKAHTKDSKIVELFPSIPFIVEENK